MHRLISRLLLSAFLLASGVAFASGPVIVTISPPPKAQDAERGFIQVRIRNEGTTPVYMFGPVTLDHMSFVNVLCIRDASGRAAEQRINPGHLVYEPEAFVRIDPRGELRNTVDLDYAYALPDGPVDIRYSPQSFFDRPQGRSAGEDDPPGQTSSNTLRIWINRSLLRPASDHPEWQPEISKNIDCQP
ncbi:hypothetical protein C8J98_103343 [Luteibacter sp. OK325]|uniref:hypothetical protein n=1 Tax=Luteibacter sp. OK325 TaxID=2135670 RepID=UPI000D3B4225|nr:hypothetical protein [Luteibacter sp. OK325]PTR33580.1 hypothetical protein C8J98_103343 [Luteibacter sp. OK325]